MSYGELSHLGTLFFNDRILGFKLRKKCDESRIGDLLLFYPSIDIDKYTIDYPGDISKFRVNIANV